MKIKYSWEIVELQPFCARSLLEFNAYGAMENVKVDVLALGAHPDDVELSCGGTICLLVQQGYRVGIVDFTRGELGSRGTPELRAQEAAEASRIMGVHVRENLGIPDGHIELTPENRLRVIRVLRTYRPHILLINAPKCRHPDHCRAAKLALEASFYAGLRRIETFDEAGNPQEPWRPAHVLHYIQAVPLTPTLVVDVSSVWDCRIRALRAYRSQFFHEDYQPGEEEPQTFISQPEFWHWIEARAREYGYLIGAAYAEPFVYHHPPFGVDDLVATFRRSQPFK